MGSRFLVKHQLLIAITSLVVVCGCSALDILPSPPKKKKIVYVPSTEPPPVAPPISNPPSALSPERLLRRMSLDATNRLPAIADLDAVVADPRDYYKLVDAYLATDAAGAALAAMHKTMWNLSDNNLADLDYFIAGGDADLAAPLTQELRQQILAEPVAMVRYILDQDLPLSTLFSARYTVASDDVLALWSWPADEAVFPEEGLSLSMFDDGRPAIGLLASQGFWAALSTTHSPHPRNRTASLMRSLLCFEPKDIDNHLFYELPAEVFSADIPATAAASSPCKNCHAHFETPATTLGVIAAGETFSDWLSFTGSGEATSSTYAGHLYTGIEELASFMGEDPRWHQCEVRRLTESLFQRPSSDLDNQNMIRSLETFYRNDLDLKTAAAELLKSKEYGFATVSPKAKGIYATEYSGIRLLKKEQWEGILDQLSLAAGALTVPDSLNPGAEETVTSDRRVPSGSYWHATERIARQAATAIVNEELADDYSAAARRVFKYLPDGSGTGASGAQLREQLKFLWRLFMGKSLANDDPELTQLVNFWNEAISGRSSDEDLRDAWNTVLIGIFTHPDFFTY